MEGDLFSVLAAEKGAIGDKILFLEGCGGRALGWVVWLGIQLVGLGVTRTMAIESRD